MLRYADMPPPSPTSGFVVKWIIKESLYRMWCVVNRLGDSGVNRLSDTSAFDNTAGSVFISGVHAWLVMTFNYLILWVRVKGQG